MTACYYPDDGSDKEVIGMEFLGSFLRHHFLGETKGAVPNVGCCLRIIMQHGSCSSEILEIILL